MPARRSLGCCDGAGSSSSSSSGGTGSSESSSSEEDSYAEVLRNKVLSAKLNRRLGNKLSLALTNGIVRKYFKRYAELRREDGSRGLGPGKIELMGVEVANALRVPHHVFRQLPTVFERFDFEGCGMLSEVECTTMFRSLMRQKRKELHGHARETEVPAAALDERGYVVERELGRGGQGVMYLCSKDGSDDPYCVKFYDKSVDDDIDDIIEEYTLMKSFDSEYIAKTYEVFQDDHYYYLVNEPYFGGDLTKLHKRAHDSGIRMTEAWWRDIFSQCLKGLEFLHGNAIMHCDIKEDNIMVRSGDSYESPKVVLIDFGLAEGFSCTSKGASGTPGYIPLETLETGWWYPRGDIFSMGVTFFQLIIGRIPSGDGTVIGVLQTEESGSAAVVRAARELRLPWERFPVDMPVLQDLLSQMLSRDRRSRPKATQALAHRWFAAAAGPLSRSCTSEIRTPSQPTSCGRARLLEELVAAKTLQELRSLHAAFRSADKVGTGILTRSHVIEILKKHDVSEDVVSGYKIGAVPVRYNRLMGEALRTKEAYTGHFLKELWVDAAGRTAGTVGTLPQEKVAALLDSEPFSEMDDPEDLLEQMGDVDVGSQVSKQVTFGAFKQVVMHDGRVGRRLDASGRARMKRATCCEWRYCP